MDKSYMGFLPIRRKGSLVLSWFERDYFYRVEEGERDVQPSKIEAVRKDEKDFDDMYLARLKLRMEISIFPRSLFRLYFEADEFRRFVRIYIDTVQNKVMKKGKGIDFKIIVPVAEIEKRISIVKKEAEKKRQLIEIGPLVTS